MTFAPCLINSSQRFEPIKPAPPVTRHLVERDIDQKEGRKAVHEKK